MAVYCAISLFSALLNMECQGQMNIPCMLMTGIPFSVKDVTTRWKNMKDYRSRKLSKLPSGCGASAASADTS